MSIKLRKKDLDERYSFYLDIYNKGIRKREFLSLYLHKKPKNPREKTHNKETQELAEKIAAKRLLEIQSRVHGFQDKELMNSSFITYFELLAEKRRNSEGNYGNWRSALKHLKLYSKSDVKFSEINTRWLEGLKHYLSQAKKHNGTLLKINSGSSYFLKVKVALNQAVKDGILNINPGKIVSGIPESIPVKEFLNIEEIRILNETDCNIPVLKRAFLFSCLTGLRFSDIEKLVWSEVQKSGSDYYLRFRQKKTDMPETLPISESALEFFEDRGEQDELVFTDLRYSHSNNQKLQNWILSSGIKKHITFHCGRHTFATMLLTAGENIYTVSKLLGHKNLKTTEVYAKIIDSKKNEAVSKIKL